MDVLIIMNLLWKPSDEGTHVTSCWVQAIAELWVTKPFADWLKNHQSLDVDVDPLICIHYADLKSRVNAYMGSSGM